MIQDLKYCKDCDTTKPYTEFNKNATAKDGVQGWCRSCQGFKSKTHLYGLTKVEYLSLVEAQGGKCALCRTPVPNPVKFHVDHDHSCCTVNKSCGACVRGLLDRPCNVHLIMGYERLPLELQDSPRINHYLSQRPVKDLRAGLQLTP